MNNLRDDLRAAFLGATGGLFSFSVFLLVARVDEYISVGLACNVLFGSAMLASSPRCIAEDPRY